MAWRTRRNTNKLKILLIFAIICCCLVTIFLGSSFLPTSYKQKLRAGEGCCDYEGDKKIQTTKSKPVIPNEVDQKVENEGQNTSQHRLCVVVPFRERFEELLTFAPFIHRFLKKKNISHDIIVVNQIDEYRFNRASLINVGFQHGTSKDRSTPCDYIVMHDVDLLPLNHDLPYDYPKLKSVTHVAAPGLHPKYNYSSFIGGILIVPSTVFRAIDGMSNVYWGWGLEDDEFYVRLKQNQIQVIRPTGITTGKKSTFRHVHSPKRRPRDHAKCHDQYNKTRKRDKLTGLSNVNYKLLSTSHLVIDEAPLTLLNVQLHCNTQLSPWCDCSNRSTNQNNATNITNVQKPASQSSKSIHKSQNQRFKNGKLKY